MKKICQTLGVLSVAFSTLVGLAAYASDFSFWQITFNVRAIHRQVDQACTSCFRGQQRIQAIEKRLNKLDRANFCPQKTRQLTEATAELLLPHAPQGNFVPLTPL
jgi:hypothetical protein